MQYAKVKSVAKSVLSRGKTLQDKIRTAMNTTSSVVGSTLGPGGMPVLIERQEVGMAPLITKDGVTVFRSLGFDDPVVHSVMEAARDAAVQTASEAGDGTTTATVLSAAIVEKMEELLKASPKVSPQKVVRNIEGIFKKEIEPAIRQLAIKKDWSTEEGQSFLKKVASLSANGDADLAEAVMQCFQLVGDDGNVTITEGNGPSHYEVEKIEGFPIPVGYEESCLKFYSKFVNDPGQQRVFLEKPVVVVYNGKITGTQAIVPLMQKIGSLWENEGTTVEDGKSLHLEDWGGRHNVLLVATGFSDSVIGDLAINFAHEKTINVFPLVAPESPLHNGQQKFLEDLACVSGARVLDPLSYPLDRARTSDLGYGDGLTYFEATRFRSTLVGVVDPEEIVLRADEIQANIDSAESILEKTLLQERLGKLTGGIAKLKVIGSSSGELKEKRDRAEDAVCAVRGAIKNGCLPGGAWTLLKLREIIYEGLLTENNADTIARHVLASAFFAPFSRILENLGHNEEEIEGVEWEIVNNFGSDPEHALVFDGVSCTFVKAVEGGILDSTPAVLEAVRNAISIASLLGTLGGTVVFARDAELERQEGRDMADFVKTAEGG